MSTVSELRSNVSQLLNDKFQLRAALDNLLTDIRVSGKPRKAVLAYARKALRETTFTKIKAPNK